MAGPFVFRVEMGEVRGKAYRSLTPLPTLSPLAHSPHGLTGGLPTHRLFIVSLSPLWETVISAFSQGFYLKTDSELRDSRPSLLASTWTVRKLAAGAIKSGVSWVQWWAVLEMFFI